MRYHHSNSRRFLCPCGRRHEWPNAVIGTALVKCNGCGALHLRNTRVMLEARARRLKR